VLNAAEASLSAMLENLASPSFEAERAELMSVTGALARYPRLASLAQYLGEKHLSGKTEEINEYNIATEVFGRSKTIFNASEDSIVRVEAHRLRKRLKDYYENEGKLNAIQLSLPSGTYIPVFMHLDASQLPKQPSPESSVMAPPVRPAAGPGVSQAPGNEENRGTALHRQRWLYALLAVGLAFATFALYRSLHPANSVGAINTRSSANTEPLDGRPQLSPATFMPLRMIAGYTGPPQTDSEGNLWKADQYYEGGSYWVRPAGFIGRTSDPFLFRQWRKGDFSYNIPLAPGVYELHLYFVASERDGDHFATFNVAINGENALAGFDVVTDALGENIADERVFRDVSPAKDGMLRLQFMSLRGVPILNALEILPGIPRKQHPIRLVTQLVPYTDHSGNRWSPDTYFVNGAMSGPRQPVSGTSDPGIYGAERYGHFTYALPVDPRDRYTVVLHFAEFYFGSTASGSGGTGDRVFRVLCNGATLLDNFDIFKEAGSLHPLTKTFYHLKPTAQGKLNLTFEPVVNYATISGIEVFDESN
jgi:hypothetical protein